MDHFDKFLKELADQLTVNNVNEAKFLYRRRIPARKAENIKDSLSLLIVFEEVELISELDISVLYELFENLPRRDLVPMLDNFKEKYTSRKEIKSPSESIGDPYESTNDFCNYQKLTEVDESNGNSYGNYHKHFPSNGRNDNNHLHHENGNGQHEPKETDSCDDVKSNTLLSNTDNGGVISIPYMMDDQPEEYSMTKPKHGQCIIFDNRFDDTVKLPGQTLGTRYGSEKDATSLEQTFTWLGFDVTRTENKSAKEIISILDMMACQQEQAENECFVCCILSHGFDGGLYGSDGSMLMFEDIKSIFDGERAKYLLEKPKLFFIQACQGVIDGKAVMLQADSPIAQDHLEGPTKSIASDADFLFFIATTPGKVSWRSTEDGTWFIQTLCKVLQEKACSWSLLDMLVYVNRLIARKSVPLPQGVDARQMSDIGRITLRKRLFFHPRKPFF